MNATEMGRRSDSLYYDNVSRRELCDRIAHLESDLEDAKDKNAEVWGSLKARETKLAFQIDDNAKLRGLVKALLQCHVEDTDTCAKCSYRSPLHGGCMADVMADNLGIEV